jgi:hypothetical protein
MSGIRNRTDDYCAATFWLEHVISGTFQLKFCNSQRYHETLGCYLLPAGFLLGLFFNLEDGGGMFLRNLY